MNLSHWPWPRFIQTQHRLFYITKFPDEDVHIFEAFLNPSGVWVKNEVLNLGEVNLFNISIADFGPFYVFGLLLGTENNLSQETFYRDVSVELGSEDPLMVQMSNPKFGVVGNFNNQFIGGNILSLDGTNYEGLGENGIIWGGIGNFLLNPSLDITSGFARASAYSSGSNPSVVYKLMKLGNKLIIYTSNGRMSFSPETIGNTFTYSNVPLEGTGITNGNHVSGCEFIHGFIDIADEFNIINPEGKVERLGFREFIKPMREFTHPSRRSDLLVSYLQRDNRFYISNGNECLVINRYGAYKCHQLVSSVFESYNRRLLGTFFDTQDREARITSDSLSFGSRGIKSLESLTSDLESQPGSKGYYSVNWRMDKTKPFRDGKLHFDGPTGQSGIHVAGVEFQLKVKVDEYQDSQLSTLLSNVKFSDQRFKRGTVPRQKFISGDPDGDVQ